MFSLPPGLETTFHITTPFKEMWFAAQNEIGTQSA